jgi:hypothetical protein
MRRLGVDLVAVAASLLTIAVLVFYLVLLARQDEQPPAWAVAALLVGAAGAAYGAWFAAPHRRWVLRVAGVTLTLLGVLAILTIGLPIILAGLLCLGASVRSGPVS